MCRPTIGYTDNRFCPDEVSPNNPDKCYSFEPSIWIGTAKCLPEAATISMMPRLSSSAISSVASSAVRTKRKRRAILLLNDPRPIAAIGRRVKVSSMQCAPAPRQLSFPDRDCDRRGKSLSTHDVAAIFALDKDFYIAIAGHIMRISIFDIHFRFYVRICCSRGTVIADQQYFAAGCYLQQPCRFLADGPERDAADLCFVPNARN
jgi:hypothetical protein